MSNSGLFDYSATIAERTKDFTGREWVFEKLDAWLGNPHGAHVFLLAGGPGTGKSTVAARLAQMSLGQVDAAPYPRLSRDSLAYFHFCQAQSDKTLNPLRFVEALSVALANCYPPFAEALLQSPHQDITVIQNIGTAASGSRVTGMAIQSLHIGNLSARSAFDWTVRRPLEALCTPDFSQTIVILVDSLDEALTFGTDSNIVSLLKHVLNDAKGLPAQVRFILTCRSNEKRVLDVIAGDERVDLINDAPPGSIDDVGKYAHRRLGTLEEPQRSALAGRIAAKSQGNFLYARFVLDDLLAPGRPVLDPDTLELPDKLEGAYHQFLEREVGEDSTKWQANYRPVLGALAVARGAGLTRQQILSISGLHRSTTDDVLKACSQFLAPSPPQGPFRFYHESFREYLQSDEDPTFQVYPAEAHETIGHFFVGKYGANWGLCPDEYALQYTPIHLLEAAYGAEPAERQCDLAEELHRLLLDSNFGDAAIGRFYSPRLFFDDLRLGLELALEKEDLVQTWRYVDRYRAVLQEERRPDRVVADVQAGNFEAALDRTALYGAMPNSQGMMRLWIAWHAAVAEQAEMADRAASLALGGLPSRGAISGAAEEADPDAVHNIRDALSTALRWLLIRLACAVAPSGEDPAKWLRKVAASWQPEEVDSIVAHLNDSLAAWGSEFLGPSSHETIDDLLGQIQGAATSADHPMYFRQAAYDYQRRLAAALYQERANSSWQGHVAEVVSRLSLDDYPSYREMALAWIAAAVLCHENDVQARQVLGTVLVGALGVPEPGFGGEAVVAALQGLAREAGKKLKTDELAEALKYAGSTTMVPTPAPLRTGAGLPPDPWAFEQLRRSAVAEALHRQGRHSEATSVLDEAGQLGREGSYAGYRVLARLSLVCRWLEWHRLDKAEALCADAREDAINMLDKVLGREREGLVDALKQWLEDLQSQAYEVMDTEAALRRTADFTGMMHSLHIQFLAALWRMHPDRLKRLVPLALTDVTAMDAVLGRLFAGLAAQGPGGQSFKSLVQEMGIQYLANQFVVNG